LESQAVRGAVHPMPAPVQEMGIDHRCAYVLMPEQLLNRPDVVAGFNQMSGKGMPEGVATGRLRHLVPLGTQPFEVKGDRV